MRFITDRKEIAKAINIDRLPVITINVAHEMNGYADCYKGCRVEVATPSKNYPDMTMQCEVAMYGDEAGNADKHDMPWMYKSIKLTSNGIGIHGGFGYSDVMEMASWANAPKVKAGQKVVVIFDNKEIGACWIRMMKVSDRVDPFCSTVATLKDIDE